MQNSDTPSIADAVRNFDALPDSAYVSASALATLYDVHRKTIWSWAKDKRIPPPEKLGPHTSRWSVGKLRQHRAKSLEAA